MTGIDQKVFLRALRPWELLKNWWRYDRMKFMTKSSKRTQKSKNRQKKIRKKWTIWLTHIMSCKNFWDKET